MLLARTLLILIAWTCSVLGAFAEPVTTVRTNGSPANRVDIVIVGDGYTSLELSQAKYATDVEALLDKLFAQEPYREYQHYFNVHRVDVASSQSGADHPSRGEFRNTALNATYDCNGTTRLVCADAAAVSAVLSRSIPDMNARDIIVVLVNDPEYGGSGGGSQAVVAMHADAGELLLHELGHHFGLLADEYGGDPTISCSMFEPPAANATHETRREALKWRAWVDSTTPIPTETPSSAVAGLFEGAMYCDVGMFRPTYDSKMRSLYAPFEQVNVEAHVDRIYNRVSPIDTFAPQSTALQVRGGDAVPFRVTVPSPYTHALNVQWTVDGVRVSTGVSFSFRASDFAAGQHTVTVTVSDPTPFVRSDPYNLLRDSQSWSVSIVGGATPFGGTARAVPGTVEAEDFDEGGKGVAYYDTSAANTGGQYRTTDVDIERTTDTGGGYNVGWLAAGEWLQYTIAVAESRTYTLKVRVAANAAGGTFHIEFDGVNKTGALTIPDTGGWQTWRDVSVNVALAAGVQSMRIVADSNGASGVFGNLNSVHLTVVPASGSTPYGGSARAVPGTIQAEDFDEGGKGIAYHDTSSANTGGQYRTTDVDIERTMDTGGGYNVGWLAAGEWLNYTVAVAQSRTYTLRARVAANAAGGTFHVEFGGVNKTGPLTIPNTGGWQTWRDVTVDVTLTAGVQSMRIVADSNGAGGMFGNLNSVQLTAVTVTRPTPFGGTPRAVPGVIQAEDFDDGGKGIGYYDTSAGNTGGQYRTTDVDIERTTDVGNGHDVGWLRSGEWLHYTVSVTESRTYSLTVRVAASSTGGTFHIEFGGVNKTGPLTIPNTGGWQTWRDVTVNVTLSAGVQSMRVVADADGAGGIFGNINYVALR